MRSWAAAALVRSRVRPGMTPRAKVAIAAGGEAQGGGDGELGEDGAVVAAFVGVAGVEGGEEAEVIDAGEAGVEEADDREPGVAAGDDGGEDVELAEEAAGEGDPMRLRRKKARRAPRKGRRRAAPVKSSRVRWCSS